MWRGFVYGPCFRHRRLRGIYSRPDMPNVTVLHNDQCRLNDASFSWSCNFYELPHMECAPRPVLWATFMKATPGSEYKM